MVFVHPDQFRTVMQALNGLQLKASHVIFADSLEHVLEETLGACHKAWAKDRRLLLEDAASDSSLRAEADSAHAERGFDAVQHWTAWAGLEVRRTFLCTAPLIGDAAATTRSTTDARPGTKNPRARLASSSSDGC
jgi:hypothetical protein